MRAATAKPTAGTTGEIRRVVITTVFGQDRVQITDANGWTTTLGADRRPKASGLPVEGEIWEAERKGTQWRLVGMVNHPPLPIITGSVANDTATATLVRSLAGLGLVEDQSTPGFPGAGLSGLGLPSFSYGGPLMVITGKGRIYNDLARPLTISLLRASVEVVAAGSPIVVNLAMDGVSLGLPLSIAAGTFTITRTVSVAWLTGSYLSVIVSSVGSGYPGESLTVSASAS